jgi:hypothetical protein
LVLRLCEVLKQGIYLLFEAGQSAGLPPVRKVRCYDLWSRRRSGASNGVVRDASKRLAPAAERHS